MTITTEQFEFIRRLMEEQVGLLLDPTQNLFVASRLLTVARRHGWDQLDPFFAHLQRDNDRAFVQELTESLLTHETSFFRDSHYFEKLTEQVLPQLIARRSNERRLSIWCAACSTGQEAYSLAMILRERFREQLRGWQVELLATDVSTRAIELARAGIYSEVEVRRGLSEIRLSQHFRRQQSGWLINEELRQLIRFQQMNLIGSWSQISAPDLVLLRNVLIYMSPLSRQSILSRMERIVPADGVLMLGSTELGQEYHGNTCRPD